MAKKKKDTKKKAAVKEEPVVNAYEEAISFAVEAFRAGKSEKYIADLIHHAHPVFTVDNLNFIVNRASSKIALEHARDRSSIVSLHVKRYNIEIDKAFEDLKKVEETKEAPHIKRQKKIDLLDNVLAVLFAKERVLQLHGKDTQIKVFNRLNAKVRDRRVGYDISALTFDQKLELLNLVVKCKKSASELFSVKLNAKQEQQKTEDAEFEVLENDNIDRIQKTNIPALPEPPHPIDELKEKAATPMDIMQKIQEALKRKAEEEFKAKGAKI